MQPRSKWLMIIPLVALIVLLACGSSGTISGGNGNGNTTTNQPPQSQTLNEHPIFSYQHGSFALDIDFTFPPQLSNVNNLYGWFYVSLQAGSLSLNTNDNRVRCVIDATTLGFKAYSSGTPVAFLIENPSNLAEFLVVGYGCYQAFHGAVVSPHSSTTGIDVYGSFTSTQLRNACLPPPTPSKGTPPSFTSGGCRTSFGNRVQQTATPVPPR